MSKTVRTMAVLVALVLVVGGAVGASATDSRAATNKYTGCRNTTTGTLDQVKVGLLPMGGACGAGEEAVTWNKRGPRGPQGPIGATGAPGVSGYEQVEHVISTTASLVEYYADCPPGKKVVGGGFRTISAAGYAVQSNPAGESRWYVKVQKTAGASTWGLDVYAICVTALP